MKRATGFEKDVPLALSVFVLWSTGVVLIPYLQAAPFQAASLLVSFRAIYVLLHLVTFAIAVVSLGKLLNPTSLHLLRRDAFLHLLLYLYVIGALCASLYLILPSFSP
jgi:hypothetical protein